MSATAIFLITGCRLPRDGLCSSRSTCDALCASNPFAVPCEHAPDDREEEPEDQDAEDAAGKIESGWKWNAAQNRKRLDGCSRKRQGKSVKRQLYVQGKNE